MLNGYVVQCTYHYVEPVHGLLIITFKWCVLGLVSILDYQVESLSQLILNENECFHGMMKCQLVLVHL